MRVWDKKAIQDLLERSDKAVERAILAIYARQTEDEKRGGTKHQNGVGFGAFDGVVFSKMAEEIKFHGSLGGRRCDSARYLGIKKYWRQLVEIANENELRKAQILRIAMKEGEYANTN